MVQCFNKPLTRFNCRYLVVYCCSLALRLYALHVMDFNFTHLMSCDCLSISIELSISVDLSVHSAAKNKSLVTDLISLVLSR